MKYYNFAKQGKNVLIFPYTTIIQPESIHIHDRVMISEYTWLMGGKHLHIGNFVHIACFVSIAGGGETYIGDFVGLCAGSRIVSGTDLVDGSGLVGPTVSQDKETRSVERSYVVVNKHAFIGTNAVINPSIEIGEGAVVAPGSVVTKDLDPWTMYKGIPARPYKDRDNRKIKLLEKTEYEKYSIFESKFKEINKGKY